MFCLSSPPPTSGTPPVGEQPHVDPTCLGGQRPGADVSSAGLGFVSWALTLAAGL